MRPSKAPVASLPWCCGLLLAIFTVLGLSNIVNPKTVDDVKVWYTENGFGEGATNGNPPFGLVKSYDLQTEAASLSMFAFYMDHHVAGALLLRQSLVTMNSVMAPLSTPGSPRRTGKDVPAVSERDRGYLFSSTYEYAAWAAQVRLRNAEHESVGRC